MYLYLPPYVKHTQAFLLAQIFVYITAEFTMYPPYRGPEQLNCGESSLRLYK